MSSVHAAGSCSTVIPMDAVARAGACGLSGNQVLNEYPALSAGCFICREPRCIGMLRRCCFALSGAALAYAALSLLSISSPLGLLLSIVAGLAVAFRQASAAIYFASDSGGVYFPSRSRFAIGGKAVPRSWLFVPWSNVSSIAVQLLLDESASGKGVTFSLRVREEERRVYFPGTSVPGDGASASIGNGALIRVGYPAVFSSPYKTAALLRGMQGRSQSSLQR